MKFDRTALCGCAEAACRLENGKAVLEWAFHLMLDTGEQVRKVSVPLRSEEERNLLRKEKGYIRLILTDKQNNIMLECVQKLREEEPLQSILLQPALWRGIRDPHLYGMEAILADETGNLLDRAQGQLALRCLSRTDRNGKTEILLNNEDLTPRAVRYTLPEAGTAAAIQRQMLEDLQWMLKLGANCVCLETSSEKEMAAWPGCMTEAHMEFRMKADHEVSLKANTEHCREICPDVTGDAENGRKQALYNLFLQLCDRCGFLVFLRDVKRQEYTWAHGKKTRLPVLQDDYMTVFRGKENSCFHPGSSRPDSLFYRYQARWNRIPFVHIVPESIRRLKSGNYAVLCYSNCGRVAMYSDGILFEYKSGEEEFYFQEIPARTPTIMLTAEGEGCCETLSIHKSFTK